MKTVYIVVIAVGCYVVISVIGFYLYQEMSRQAILEQTSEGYDECLRNFKNVMNLRQVEEFGDCIENLTENLMEFNEGR